MVSSRTLKRRIAVAQGREPADLVLRNTQFLDVFSCQWRTGDITICDGVIAATDGNSPQPAIEVVDAQGRWCVPGFVDAHVHLESSLLLPEYFEQLVLPKGTTSAICDPHELANVLGLEGIRYFLQAAKRLKLDLWVMLSSCVPCTPGETNGGGNISAETLAEFEGHPRVLGLAEMMNVPGVLGGDPEVLKKLEQWNQPRRQTSQIDGHAPLLSGRALSAYVSAGISSCHESGAIEEAREKLSKGMAIWIREGSVAKDLRALAPLINAATSPQIGFCTDDRNPLDIGEEGHIDHLVRLAIEQGVAPELAYRCASLSVAQHYGLTRGTHKVGAIAPGYAADLVLLNDPRKVSISEVYKRGIRIGESFFLRHAAPPNLTGFSDSVQASVPAVEDLKGPEGRVCVIGVSEGKLVTDHLHDDAHAQGVQKLSVIERYGRGQKPANGYVYGFGRQLQGAIASSVGHDSHNLIVVGSQTKDMQTAIATLIRMKGGFCVIQGQKVLAELPLRLGGLMSTEAPDVVMGKMRDLKRASRAIGCELKDPFLQLAFLSLSVIPALKLTDRGLVATAPCSR